jgi:hypothetical protein
VRRLVWAKVSKNGVLTVKDGGSVGMAYRKGTICFTLLLILGVTHPVLADSMYTVTIDTSAVNGTSGKLVFDFLVNSPSFSRHVDILSFSAPSSTAGLPETEGGLVEGELILPPFNSASFTRIGGSFFFNELIVNFISFGNSISFTLSIADIGPSPGGLPDQFALFLLDATGFPLFPTSDPLGSDALFAIDITGAPGGDLSVFSPTVFTPPNSLDITVPSPNLPPTADAGPNQFVPAETGCLAMVTLDGTGSTDPDGDQLTFTWTGSFGKTSSPTPMVSLRLGTHVIVLVVDDGHGGTSSDTVSITVVDATPPVIGTVTATPNVLWPPNHRMVSVLVSVSVSDICDGASVCKIISVDINEPINGTGDGNTAVDLEFTGNLTVNLRAERAGSGAGRVYTITVVCTDTSGNSSTTAVAVTVPHDMR